MARGRTTTDINGIHKSPAHRAITADYIARREDGGDGGDVKTGLFQLACTEGPEYRDFALPFPSRSEQLRSDKADMVVTRPQVRRRTAVACARCRKRKIRCTGDEGHGIPCRTCRNAGAGQCTFSRVGSLELGCVQQMHLPSMDAANETVQYLTGTGGIPFATGGGAMSAVSPASPLLRGEAGGGEAGGGGGGHDVYARSYGVHHHGGYHGHHDGHYQQEHHHDQHQVHEYHGHADQDQKYGHHAHEHPDRHHQPEWVPAAAPDPYDPSSPVSVNASSRMPPISDAFAPAYDPLLPWNPHRGGGPSGAGGMYLDHHHHHAHAHAAADQGGSHYDTAMSMVQAAHRQQQQVGSVVAASAAASLGAGDGFVPRLPPVVGVAPVQVTLPSGFPVLASNVGPALPLLPANGLLGLHHHEQQPGQYQQLGHQHQQPGQYQQLQQLPHPDSKHQYPHSRRILPTPPGARTPALAAAGLSRGSGQGIGYGGDSSIVPGREGGSSSNISPAIAASTIAIGTSMTTSGGAGGGSLSPIAAPPPPLAPALSPVFAPDGRISSSTATATTAVDVDMMGSSNNSTASVAATAAAAPAPNMYPRVPHAWSATHATLGPLESSFSPAAPRSAGAQARNCAHDGNRVEADGDSDHEAAAAAATAPLPGPRQAPARSGPPPPMSAFQHSFDASAGGERETSEASTGSSCFTSHSSGGSSSSIGRSYSYSYSSSFGAAAGAGSNRGSGCNGGGSRGSRRSSGNGGDGGGRSFGGRAAHRTTGPGERARRGKHQQQRHTLLETMEAGDASGGFVAVKLEDHKVPPLAS